MPTNKQSQSSGSQKKAAGGSRPAGNTAKGSKSGSSRTRDSNAKAAAPKGSGSKKTNSGGTMRTASQQAQPTKSKQASAARSGSSRTSGRSNSGSSKGTTSSRSKTGGAKKQSEGLLTRVVKTVGRVLSGGPTDALDLLKKDHRKVEGLFSKAKANEDGNNASVFKKIKMELDVHAHIEEKILYPFLLGRGNQELNRIVREGIEEHRQVKMFLGELSELSGNTEAFRAKLKVLMEDVEHHVQEEEDEMFPMVREQIDDKDIQKLGPRLQKEKAKVMERMAARKKTPATGRRTAAARRAAAAA